MNQKNESDTEQVAQRRAKLTALRETGNAFPNDFRRDAEAAELVAKYNGAETEALESQQIECFLN